MLSCPSQGWPQGFPPVCAGAFHSRDFPLFMLVHSILGISPKGGGGRSWGCFYNSLFSNLAKRMRVVTVLNTPLCAVRNLSSIFVPIGVNYFLSTLPYTIDALYGVTN